MNRKIGPMLFPDTGPTNSLILILKLSGTKEVILDLEPRLDRIG